MLLPKKDVKHFVITENPIDALEHRKNNSLADHTIYLCTCGNLTKGIKKELLQVFSQAHIKGQSISLVGLGIQDLEQVKTLLEDKRVTYKTSSHPTNTMGIHAMLSKVSQTLESLTSMSSDNDSGEEEEDLKKRKNKGRRI